MIPEARDTILSKEQIMERPEKIIDWGLIAAAVCGLILQTLALSAQETRSKTQLPGRWAILIGVDDYAQAQDLRFCGADQRAFREKLIQAGFPEDNVFLLHDDAKEKRYLPFKGNIEKQLDLVLGLLEKDDLVVLSFSGHGMHFGGKSYICPTDARLDDPNSLVSMDLVYDRLKRSPAAFKLVVVDACRNDPRPGGQRSLTPSDGTRQFAQALERPPEGLVLLNSCAPGEISWEEAEFGHGVFMHFLMDGLSGQADENRDGKVSLNELSQYAGRKTKLHVAKKFNDSQRPFLRGDLTLEAMDFDLGNAVAKVSTTPSKPPVTKNTTSATTSSQTTTSTEAPVIGKAYVDGTGPGWRSLGDNDFINVNCDPDTWRWNDENIKCTGKPIGVIRTKKAFTNFELVVEWRHLQTNGNSGLLVWVPDAVLQGLPPNKLPRAGIEVQILDVSYAESYEKAAGKKPDWFTSHGDVFPIGGTKMTPFAPFVPNSMRSLPSKFVSKGIGEWNHYFVRAMNGEIRLSVNGEQVSGGKDVEPRVGYLCLVSEGSQLEFRNLRIRELP